MGRRSPTNATLSVANYGTLDVRIRSITFGLEIMSSSKHSRMFRTLYTRAITDEAFGIEVICTTHAEYERLGTFLLNYGRKVAEGNLGMMRVRYPARQFDRLGVPNGSTFGREVQDVTWPMAIAFVGATDLVSPVTRDVTALSNIIGAEYLNAIHKDPSAAYYYPSGSQLTGVGAGADLLYDNSGAAIGGGSDISGPDFGGTPTTDNRRKAGF